MSEEPQLPPMPDLGDILDRKKRMVEKITTVIKCKECKAKYERPFKVGDYTFKALSDEICEKCKKSQSLDIEEIYSEWIDPKKQ
ncbi:MAG: hypothetical protein P8Y23_04105 [Candidatus Lokiarchaeota archaeon]|jgi:Zn finger protein HypA/HybF involved in hydrogenase expression